MKEQLVSEDGSVNIERGSVPIIRRLDLAHNAWPPAGTETLDPAVSALPVAHFHPRSSDHHPKVVVFVAHEGHALFLHFVVEDRYVVARHTRFQGQVCEDSCVEAFLAPVAGRGYFNFEFNCCGVMLASYCPRPIRQGGHQMLPDNLGQLVQVRADLRGPIAEEITQPVHWTLTTRIPLAVMEPYIGTLGDLGGCAWRANFYKCADKSSRPHWASWQSVGELLDFHQPSRFGEIHFA